MPPPSGLDCLIRRFKLPASSQLQAPSSKLLQACIGPRKTLPLRASCSPPSQSLVSSTPSPSTSGTRYCKKTTASPRRLFPFQAPAAFPSSRSPSPPRPLVQDTSELIASPPGSSPFPPSLFSFSVLFLSPSATTINFSRYHTASVRPLNTITSLFLLTFSLTISLTIALVRRLHAHRYRSSGILEDMYISSHLLSTTTPSSLSYNTNLCLSPFLTLLAFSVPPPRSTPLWNICPRRNSFLPLFTTLASKNLRVSKLIHLGPFATSLSAFIITPTSFFTIAAAAIAIEVGVTLSRSRLQLLIWHRVAALPVTP